MSQFAIWRTKANDGTLTPGEMKQAIMMLRGARRTAAADKPASRAKAKGPAKSADDLLGELDAL
jgi:hypothetical protein